VVEGLREEEVENHQLGQEEEAVVQGHQQEGEVAGHLGEVEGVL
jgi:hypothetical protein